MENNDSELLLSKIPETQGLGNNTAKTMLGWDDTRYQAAKSALLADGKIKLGPGKGGSIKRVQAGETVPVHEPKHEPVQAFDFSGFENDEDAFMSLIPANGHVNNRKLAKILGWDEEKFQDVRKGLIAANKIVTAVGGAGGASRRFKAGDEKAEVDETEIEDSVDVENPENNKDPMVFTADSVAEAEGVIARLKVTGYPTTTFYVAHENDKIIVKIKRRYPVAMNPDVRATLQDKVGAAMEWYALQPKSTPTEVPAVEDVAAPVSVEAALSVTAEVVAEEAAS